MDFKEFCKETQKIKLYPGHLEEFSRDAKFALNKGHENEINFIEGLYFPNDKEIEKLVKLLSPENGNKMYVDNSLIVKQDYNLDLFFNNLKRKMNMDLTGTGFDSSRDLLKSQIKLSKRDGSSKNIVEIIGEIYTSINLLDNDIRIRALNGNYQDVNLIVDFRPKMVGFMGVPAKYIKQEPRPYFH